MIKTSTYSDFFPYPSYRIDQENIINQIENAAREKKNVLLIAPNGTGKTVSVLSALLPVALENDLKIVYMCRTHTQSARVIKELQKIHKSVSTSYKISGLSIRGRNEMCLNSTLQKLKLSPSESMAVCRDLRKNKKCIHYRNVKAMMKGNKTLDSFQFDKPIEAEELLKLCKDHRYCPYFLSKYLLKKMNIVICNFQWVFNPDIKYRFFKLLGTDISNTILVIDECHNIIDVATSVNSNSLIPSFLTSCINDMRMYRIPESYIRFAQFIKNNLEQKKRDLTFGETEIDPKRVLATICKKLKLDSTDEFISFMLALKESLHTYGKEGEEETVDLSKNRIRAFIKFWLNWVQKHRSDRYFFCYAVKKANNRKYINLEIVALEPRDITIPLFNNSYACVSLSGTVNGAVFNNLTGLRMKKAGYEQITAPSPFPSRNIKAFITKGVNTAKDSRHPEMYKKMIEKIQEVVLSTPANIGIFCASYKILNDLQRNGLITIVKESKKLLLVEEPRMSASRNADMLKKFKASSKTTGAVLLGVCGGRNSEGEDFPGDFMNAVIIAGIPYHLPTPRVKAKIKYYNKVFRNQGWVFGYLYPAMQRANQASGRPIRKENDKGVIVFLDSRFKERLGWISEWVRDEIEIVPDHKNNIKSALNGFWSVLI